MNIPVVDLSAGLDEARYPFCVRSIVGDHISTPTVKRDTRTTVLVFYILLNQIVH